MHAPLPKSLNAALPLALVLGLLSGCAEHLETHQTDNAVVGGYRHMFHHGNWQQGPAPFKNYVEPVTLSHDVLFQPGQAALTDAGRKELHAFLRTEGVGTDEQLVLQAPQGSDSGHDPLTAARRVHSESETAAAPSSELLEDSVAVIAASVVSPAVEELFKESAAEGAPVLVMTISTLFQLQPSSRNTNSSLGP